MSSVATLNQVRFRVRTDTGAVNSTPTWAAAEDTSVSYAVEVPFCIRFTVNNTGTAAGAGPHILRVSKNAGAYTAVTTSTGATLGAQSEATASSDADETAIPTASFRLTAGTGTALAGVYDETGSLTKSITNGFYTELEYGLILKTAGAAPGDTFDFRIYNSTTAFTTYTQTPRVTVPLVISQDHFRFRADTGAVDAASPTWVAAEDTNINGATGSSRRIRFGVSNPSSASSSSTFVLRVAKNGSSTYNAVTTSTGASLGIASSNASTVDADEAVIATANFRLTAGTGTASQGVYDETGSATKTLAGGNYTEFEYGITPNASGAIQGDYFDFRLYHGTNAFSTYTQTPRLTIPAPVLVQNHYRIRTDGGAVAGTPTWGAAQDTTYYPGEETPFRIRFAIDNTGAGSTNDFILRVSRNSGAYNPITPTSTDGVQSASASSDADETSLLTANFALTAGTGSATSGTYDSDGTLARTLIASCYSEMEFGLVFKTGVVAPGDTYDFRIYESLHGAFSSYVVTPRITISAGTPNDTCLANDISSASNVTQPAVQQVHNISANDIASPSSVGQPAAVIQRDILANDVLSASSVSVPTVTEIVPPVACLANDVSSASSVSQPVAVIRRDVLANDVKSNSAVTQPAVQQLQELLANDIKSNSSVSQPAAIIRWDALANDVLSTSSVGLPAAVIGRGLLANDVLSGSSVSQPAAAIHRALSANDVTSASSVSAPIVGILGVIDARDIVSASSVTQPAVHQGHGLLANDVLSNSAVTQPNAAVERIILANDVKSNSSVGLPTIVQRQALLANDVLSASSVSNPAAVVGQAALANGVASGSSVTVPTVHQTQALLADDVLSASSVSNPLAGHIVVGQPDARDIVSASSVSQPTVNEGQTLLAADIQSASNVGNPALSEDQALFADNVISLSSVSRPAVVEVAPGEDALLANDVVSGSSVSQPMVDRPEGEIIPPEVGGGGKVYGRGYSRKKYEELLRQLEAERQEALELAQTFKGTKGRKRAVTAARAASEAIAAAREAADEAAVLAHAGDIIRMLEGAARAKTLADYLDRMKAVKAEAEDMADEDDVETILMMVA